MAKRKIIEIDEDKCDGCGQCTIACAEGALKIIDGKAKVVNEVFCDGLGACIGECPQGALRIVERDAPGFDEEAVKEHMAEKGHGKGAARVKALTEPEPCGCPSSNPMLLKASGKHAPKGHTKGSVHIDLPPELTNWPVQWRLVQPSMPFFKDADILFAADCVPFAYRDFHGKFLAGKPVVIGCPKLDDQQAYMEKLSALVKDASPKSLTVVRMEVPCCSGLTRLVGEAVRRSGRKIPVREVVVGIQGGILGDSGCACGCSGCE
jgi:NAD-dependent dihydropyrimidine dehydrogenase PreA subunit